MITSEFAILNVNFLNIATSPNSFITGSSSIYLEGGGNDNITVSSSTQNSITLADFTSGSNATINGLNPNDFTLKFSDATIGSGHELVVTASPNSANNATTTISLPGYSTADVTSGKLTVASETSRATGAPYLLIHAS
jgi:hypothetical protein